jgi:hypothetical protein
MDKQIHKAVILNNPSAGAPGSNADVDTATDASIYQIKGLFPINKKDFIKVKLTWAAIEVSQIISIGEANTVSIVAGNPSTGAGYYKIKGGNTGERELEHTKNLHVYGTYMDSVLTGGGATQDRHTVYMRLVAKINRDTGQSAFAGAVVTLTHVASTAFLVTAGKNSVWMKGSVSGAIGFVCPTVISGTAGTASPLTTSGATTESSTTTTKFCCWNGITPVVGDIFTQVNNPYEQITTGSGGPSTAVTAIALGVGIRIVDKVGYYDAKNTRKGATQWFAVAGFIQSDIRVMPTSSGAITTMAAVYPEGLGATLAKQVPVKETTSGNLLWGGLPWFPTNEAVNTSARYNYFDVYSRVSQNNSALGDSASMAEIVQRVIVDQAATNYGAHSTAMLALT